MSDKRASSMASVWETLNKMKARQKAVEKTTKSQRQYDQARKEAIAFFERRVAEAVSKEQVDGATFLSDLEGEMSKDENIRVVLDSHREKFADNTLKEVRDCASSINAISQDLKIAMRSMETANGLAQKIESAF